MSLAKIKKKLNQLKDKEKAGVYKRFFKTGKGQYGYGDKFIGVTVPKLRKLSKEFAELSRKDTVSLLISPIHEERPLALFIMILQFNKGNEQEKASIYKMYLRRLKYVNNWDLVDLSADKILGAYLHDKDKNLIYELSRSDKLWEKRIAIMSTFHFIKNNQYDDTLKIATILRDDDHDLIHKAVGWMLREIGNRHLMTEEKFLKRHYKKMPRMMLRYAIERFPPQRRQAYLKSHV